MSNKVYEIITSEIIKKLEEGTIPWERPWTGTGAPINFFSQKEYRGINTIILGMQNYHCHMWGTFKQIRGHGGTVKKGEKSTMIVFWKWLEKDSGNIDTKGNPLIDKIPMLRYYRVFNMEQTEGLPYEKVMAALEDEEESRDLDPIVECDKIIMNYNDSPEINYGGARAFYSPDSDYIQLPDREHFKTPSGYYNTLFHELVHSTGHTSRCGRKTINKAAAFGSETYSKEELVAEIGATFLCGRAGIERLIIDNSVAYIQSWLRALKNDVKMIVIASGQAQKAVDYMTDK